MIHNYQNALVLGLGRSGQGAARLLLSEGASVTVIESRADEQHVEAARALRNSGARVLTGCSEIPAESFDGAIVSPGISEFSDWLTTLRERGTPIVSELELGWSRLGARTLAVTGSLGKSTAVTWCANALAACGYRVAAAGNIGLSVSELASERPALDWLVLEVSSFQLETVRRLRPHVSLLLNVYPNHLDRHGSMERYLEMKTRLFDATTEADVCVLPVEWLSHVERHCRGRGERVLFGAGDAAHWRYEHHSVWAGEESLLSLLGTRMDNPVLGLNAAGVSAALTHCGVPPAVIRATAASLPVLEHRMQPCGEIRGVRLVNDSKSTCLTATMGALRMLPGQKRLIAGGVVKERDASFLLDTLRKEVAGAYLIGQGAGWLAQSWAEAVPCAQCGTLASAFDRALADSQPGDTILFSPGCSSFDQYRNFEERGDHFLNLVRSASGQPIRIQPINEQS